MKLAIGHLQQRWQECKTRSRQPAGWPYRTVVEAATALAREKPDEVAIYLQQEPHLSYGLLLDEAQALAAAFQNMGLLPGDVLSFQLPNWRETAIINLAAVMTGLIVNPIVIIYRRREVKYMLANSRTRLLLIPDRYRGFDFKGMVDDMRPELPDLEHIVLVRPQSPGGKSYESLMRSGRHTQLELADVAADDCKLLLYTSGTTGHPKGVLHTHRSLLWAMRNSADFWSIGEDDVMLMPSPVTHITGFANGIEFPFYNGAKSALMERWDADAAVAYIEQVKGSMSMGATPFLAELIQAAEKNHTALPSLRLYACGGADVPAELIRAAHAGLSHCRAFRVYGSTETPIVTQGFIAPDMAAAAADTDGCIVNYALQIRRADGAPCQAGEAGELLIRGPAMMLGYLRADDHRQAFTTAGYFKSGDLGYITKDNGLIITGRKKDLIIRGGENLSAKEIEDVLHEHRHIAEAAVVSMPHPRLGETVCACIRLAEPALHISLDDIAEHCLAAGLARQKLPERIEHLAKLPRTPSGKIKKDILRSMIRQRLASGG